MISQTLARRYAQALMSLGREDGKYAEYGQKLAAFVKVAETSGLIAALGNPLYPGDVRLKIFNTVITKTKPMPMLANFLRLLFDKGRFAHLKDIAEYYQRLVDEAANIKRATVTSAAPLAQEAQSRLKAALEKITGKTIVLETRQDPNLIGGLKTQIGDLVLDGTLRTQLNHLKETLLEG